jgi:hypothetical protein
MFEMALTARRPLKHKPQRLRFHFANPQPPNVFSRLSRRQCAAHDIQSRHANQCAREKIFRKNFFYAR